MPDLFNMQIYENIDYHDFLENVNAALIADGWSSIYFHKNSLWTEAPAGVWSFAPGSNVNLAIESTGEHGNQTLHYRFWGNTLAPNDAVIAIRGFDSANSAVDYGVGTHPVDNGYWNYIAGTAVANYINIPEVLTKGFIFSNSSFFLLALQCDATRVQFLTGGSPDLVDSLEDEAMFCGYSNSNGYNIKWYDNNFRSPFIYEVDNFYYDGVHQNSNGLHTKSLYSPFGALTYYLHRFENYASIINTVPIYSDLLPAFRPVIYQYFSSVDCFRPIGILPVYYINSQSFNIGEIKTFGSKKYSIFPNCVKGYSAGFALRIA
jgi:hypothetical protein